MQTKPKKINLRQSCRKFNSLSEENKNWVLDYLYGGKGVIPYGKIKLFDELDCAPNGEFFTKAEFHSSLKNEIISNEGYENVKKRKIMRLKKLSELNDIYNFHDTIILCEIFENRVIIEYDAIVSL